MKYVDERGRMRTLIAKKHLFKRVENYFTDYLLYQDPLKPAKIKPQKTMILVTKQTRSWNQRKNVFGK